MYATSADLCDQFGWEPLEPIRREGTAERLSIRRESGAKALLYRWDSEETAARAIVCHTQLVGPELFVVPECLESGINWLVVDDIPGLTLTEFLANNERLVETAMPQLLSAIGENVRKLHSLESEAVCGDVLEDSATRWLTFNGYVAAHFERYSEDVRKLDIDDATVRKVVEHIGEMRHELASFHPRSPSSLVHGRLSFDHIWVDTHGREVVGLTGFEHASYLPPEADLAWILWIEGLGYEPTWLRSLFRGYGAARTMDVQRRERFYRRLMAFRGLFGDLNCPGKTPTELVALTGSGYAV